MRAAVFNEPGLPLELTDREVSTPQAGELFIRLKAAALNRRDYWITQGMYPGLKSDVIQGQMVPVLLKRLAPLRMQTGLVKK